MKAVLLYHVVSGKVTAADVVQARLGEDVAGRALTIKVDGAQVIINNAKVDDA